MVANLAKKMVSICTHVSPVLGSKVIYFLKFKKRLNLKNPTEFNEKLMWLKLNNYNNNELVWQCADKYTLRDYCTKKGIEEKYFPRLIGVYNSADEIDFEKLPNKFALKCTHGMGFNIICENKQQLDISNVKKQLNKWLNTKFGYESAETHYNHVKPRIICEEFIENEAGEFPVDYKIYCFNGMAKIILVCVDRKKHYQTAFYDLNWNRLHLREEETNKEVVRPKSLDKMLEIANVLSKDFPFVRVDFYEYKNNPVLGEMTFTPAACLGKYKEEASKELGMYINLKK